MIKKSQQSKYKNETNKKRQLYKGKSVTYKVEIRQFSHKYNTIVIIMYIFNSRAILLQSNSKKKYKINIGSTVQHISFKTYSDAFAHAKSFWQ